MNSLICVFSLFFISLSFAALADRRFGSEDAISKRQYETTCAFYRWSHCPGKKEVDKADESSGRNEIAKELNGINSNGYFRDFERNMIEEGPSKGSSDNRKANLRKLFKFLFLKRKPEK